MSNLFTIDEEAISKAFGINTNAIKVDLSGLSDLDYSKIQIDLSQIDLSGLRDIDMSPVVQDFMNSEVGKEIASGDTSGLTQEEIREQISSSMNLVSDDVQAVMQPQINKLIASVADQLADQIQAKMTDAMRKMAGSIRNAFWVDTDAFAKAIQFNMSPEELSELMMSMSADRRESYEGNLRKLNNASEDQPSSILIYPKDFESKGRLSALIDTYNNEAREAGQDDKVITYTDYVATLMSSVTTIVDTISYVLVAFVAISLIVSSIMIGIITYISVLERTKEIGILRAIGASKRNIAQVFNAETFIVGLLAGVLGVAVALLILIPGNALIHSLTNNPNVNAVLPAFGGIALVIISVVLTVIGGLIPSGKAARKDPVAALRSE